MNHRNTQPRLNVLQAGLLLLSLALAPLAHSENLTEDDVTSFIASMEAMQPLMNMITFTQRNRDVIIGLHTRIADALEMQNSADADEALAELTAYTLTLGEEAMEARARR